MAASISSATGEMMQRKVASAIFGAASRRSAR